MGRTMESLGGRPPSHAGDDEKQHDWVKGREKVALQNIPRPGHCAFSFINPDQESCSLSRHI